MTTASRSLRASSGSRSASHGAPEIGEKDRDLLALALKGRLGCEDPFREVLWRVRLRRPEPRRRHRCAAVIAELAPGLDLDTAARTNRCECRTALATEAGNFAVICLAPGTLHAGDSDSGWRRSER